MQRSSPHCMFCHLQSDHHHNYFSLKCFFFCLVHFTKCVQPLWIKSDTAIGLIEYRVQSHWLVAQSKVICSRKPSSAWSSLFTMWMGDRYMLGFAPTLIHLESNSLQTLQKLFRWDYKPRSPVCISMRKYHTQACESIIYTCLRYCSPYQSSVDYRNTQITQHALKVSCFSQCWNWDTSVEKMKKKRSKLSTMTEDPGSHATVMYATSYKN